MGGQEERLLRDTQTGGSGLVSGAQAEGEG